MVDVAKLRKRLGGGKPISQAALAAQLGVHQTTIHRLEKGKMDFDGPVAVLLEKLDAESRAASRQSGRQVAA